MKDNEKFFLVKTKDNKSISVRESREDPIINVKKNFERREDTKQR